jgi:hypothetical protein
MSDDQRRRPGGMSRYLNGASSKLVRRPPHPGENLELQGGWSHEQLERMDRKFVAAMERAIARGLERRPKGERARAA